MIARKKVEWRPALVTFLASITTDLLAGLLFWLAYGDLKDGQVFWAAFFVAAGARMVIRNAKDSA